MNKILLITICTLCGLIFVIGTAKSQMVQPQYNDGKYSLEFANVYFEIDAEFGARITSYMADDNEIVMPQNQGVVMGSTFWPSPQSIWGWPPPRQLNEFAYTGGIKNKKIWLTSEIDPLTNLSFSKTAYANLADTSITMIYTMINHSDETQTYAPWEVTRVTSVGTVFFPKGDDEVTGNMGSSAEVIDDYVWFDPSNLTGNKFFSDGKGWLAFVNNDGYLFIKLFDDILSTNAAPGEAEVEVYVGGDVMELENQGAYAEISSSDSVSYSVKWFAHKLPPNINVSFGSQALINYALNIIDNSAPTPAVSIVNKKSIDLEIYPNPAQNYIDIKNSTIQNQKYCIYNSSGQIISRGKCDGSVINISQLANGLYFVNIITKSKSYVSSFIKTTN